MNDWILVEKALPEPETTVLVTTVHKHPETKKIFIGFSLRFTKMERY